VYHSSAEFRATQPERAVEHALDPAVNMRARVQLLSESSHRAATPLRLDLRWEGGVGVLVGDVQRATRRPATERSEGAYLGAPPERASSPQRIPAPTDRAIN
jgi:hypothetical protein